MDTEKKEKLVFGLADAGVGKPRREVVSTVQGALYLDKVFRIRRENSCIEIMDIRAMGEVFLNGPRTSLYNCAR